MVTQKQVLIDESFTEIGATTESLGLLPLAAQGLNNQQVSAERLRQGGKFVENKAYLNPEIFTNQFYNPAMEILGPHLRGFIFAQEYQPKKERVEPEEMAKSLDAFFKAVPKDKRYHIELRTEAY